MQKWQFAAVVLGISIVVAFTCGCVGQAVAPQPTQIAEAPTSSVTAMATATTRPTVCHMEGEMKVCLYSDLTPVMTTTPAATAFPTPEEIKSPMAESVILTGVGSQIVWFDTVRPGIVTFKMRPYAGPQYVKNCENTGFVVKLAGKSIDTQLYPSHPASTTKTFNLLSPGRYSLTVKSCEQWAITVS